MPEAYIVATARTAGGRKGGRLAGWHPADLAASVLDALVERTGADPAQIEDVILGCVMQTGEQSNNIARNAVMASKLPESVPATSIDRQCGSSQQALHFAAQAVMSGTQDVIAVGGVQTMTRIPISSAMLAGQALGYPDPFSGSEGWRARFGDQPVNQFYAAQRIADHWGISREQMEAFALQSHARALAAIESGRFAREIVACNGLRVDETPRLTSLAKMAELQPVDPQFPSITAAVSSQTCDASAALLVVSEAALKRYDLTPRARIHHLTVLGDDPIWHLTAPIAATRRALEKTGLRMSDIDRVEINEAFASVVMAWAKELDYDPARTNVNGGAIALGHPLGATGARLMTTLLNELECSGGRYGLQTMCEGGGQANVTIIERL